MPIPQRMIVIGGGISGLAAAWRIKQSFQESNEPLELKLLEASPRLGGSLQSIHREGFLLEMGPDCFISEKPRGVGLCKELDLENELIGTKPDHRRSFIVRDGKFYPVPEGFYLMGPSRTRPFLQNGLLSWPGKLRAMMEPLLPGKPPMDESLGSFVRRRFGQEMLDWMAQPLIAGIYGASPDELSLRATFPQFLEMERTYGSVLLGLKKRHRSTKLASGARYSLFVTLRNGMQTLIDALAAKLGPHTIETSSPVQEIRRTGELWQVVKANGDVLSAEGLCLALPSHASASLVNSLDPDWANDLASIRYAPAATLNIALREGDLKQPLNGVGFVVPSKEKRLVLGCTFAHHKFDHRVPQGFILLRAFLGGVHGLSWMEKSDDELKTSVYDELKQWLGITAQPIFMQLERYSYALPQYHVGHLPKVLRIEERGLRYPGLALAGNWQYGIGIPDCIDSGERAARTLLKKHTTCC